MSAGRREGCWGWRARELAATRLAPSAHPLRSYWLKDAVRHRPASRGIAPTPGIAPQCRPRRFPSASPNSLPASLCFHSQPLPSSHISALFPADVAQCCPPPTPSLPLAHSCDVLLC